MGKHTRNQLWFCLFWTKATLALGLSLGGLFYLCWRVYDLHSSTPTDTGITPSSVTIIDPSTGHVRASCAFNTSKGLARLEPNTANKLLLGYSLDWSYDQPTKVVSKLNGYSPPVFNAFMQLIPGTFNGTGFDVNMLNWFGSECGRTGAMLELSLEPTRGLENLTQEHYNAVAEELLSVNQKYNVPVLFRYGHEMNGNWNPYMMRPTSFIVSWNAMAAAVRARTNMTAMVWAPNIGIAYPFNGGNQPQPAVGSPDFLLLDTNKNGVLDELDDPYTPYYPGDDVVDWVALSLYNYPLPTCFDCAVPPTMFLDYFTGTGVNSASTSGQGDSTGLTTTSAFQSVHDFYQMFAADGVHNKPVMIPETGAPWIQEWAGYNAASVTERDVKLGWWGQILNATIVSRFPKLKMVVQYEDSQMQDPHASGTVLLNIFKVMNSTGQLGWWVPFVEGFKSSMVEATGLEYGCDGSVTAV
ncbi:hypothetical protein HDU98_011921 [Podochytrium sp. JEL0797]|nr:hypothetical protein HDU98_011921 [Podochytrium sp. JEL0797]